MKQKKKIWAGDLLVTATKMPGIKEKMTIPKNIQVEIVGTKVIVSGEKGKLERDFKFHGIQLKKEGEILIVSSERDSKREKRILGTFKAHFKNLVRGVERGFEYELKICSSHFPMSVSVENNFVTIKNFLGEKIPRKAKILEGVGASVESDIIKVFGVDREMVGQTAANIEKSTRRPGFDPRVFQDGIYLTNKAGRKIG